MKILNPALVLGLYFPGIAILKRLSKLGVEVSGTSYIEQALGFKLKNNHVLKSPSPKDQSLQLLKWLISFSESSSLKPVLYNTSDDYIVFLHEYKKELENHFLFPWDSTSSALMFTNKLDLYKIARKIDLAVPDTIEIKELSDWDNINLQFPILIKPLFASEWRKSELKSLVGSNKLIVLRSKKEYDYWKNTLCSYNIKVIIQEIIPGNDANLFYSVVCRSSDGIIKRFFCGQKIRITPIHFGSASYVKTCDINPFLPNVEKILNYTNYVGPAGVEFKIDERDGKIKLIEINARFGLWDDLGIDMGSDVFTSYYEDLTLQNPSINPPNDFEIKWIAFSRDIPGFRDYIREKHLSLFGWLKSIMPPIKVAEIYKGEWKLLYYSTFGRLVKKIRSKVNV